MPPVKVIILQRNLMGDLIDDEGNRYNERHQRIDYLGRVIPEPEEEPITSSLSNGGTGIWQPQTLADYNCPYFFYHKRAEIQAEMDRLNKEPPEQDFQVQEAPVQQDSEILARIQRVRKECANYFKNLDAIFFPCQPKPPVHVPEPPDLDSDPEPSEPDSKPPEYHESEVGEVLSHGDTYELAVISKEATTPGSCHKRKSSDTTFQPPHKLLRAYTGAIAVIPIAADLIDPGDTYAVYSNGPRPPPPEQWYVLFELLSSLAGRCCYPPRSHPDAAYLPDPEETDVVYHRGPRPP